MKLNLSQEQLRRPGTNSQAPQAADREVNLQHRINAAWLRLWRMVFPTTPPPTETLGSRRYGLNLALASACLVSPVFSSSAAEVAETNGALRLMTNCPAAPTNWFRQMFRAMSVAATQPTNYFRAGELTVDLFTCYTVAQPDGLGGLFKTDLSYGKFGAGIGATYWLTRNFGAGVEAAIPALDDLNGGLFQQVTFSGTARLPLGPFAPYALAGVGRDFESSRWNTLVGLGAEWRFRPGAGLFTDARYVFADHAADSLVVRAGIRLAF